MTEEFKPTENVMKLAEFMEWYAGQMKIKPTWEIKWMFRNLGTSDEFQIHNNIPGFYGDKEYRPAPRTMTINGVELVAPRGSVGFGENVVFWAGLKEGRCTVSNSKEKTITKGVYVWDSPEDCRAYVDTMNKIVRGEA